MLENLNKRWFVLIGIVDGVVLNIPLMFVLYMFVCQQFFLALICATVLDVDLA